MDAVDVKLHSFAHEFGSALHGVEVRLGTEIQKEQEERSTEEKNTNERIDAMMERLSKLESKEGLSPTHSATPSGTLGSAWRPTHMILGYAAGTERNDIEKHRNSSIAKMGQGGVEACLAAYSPRKFGLITKVRVRDGKLARAVLQAKKMLQKGGDLAWPLLAAEERSPEAGKKKRQVADAVRNLQNKYDSSDIDASGTVWWRCSEAARFELATYRWTK